MHLYMLDLIGVFAFSAFGAYKALGKRMDLFGIFLCGALTALGGGTMREMLLHGQAVYLHNYTYIGVVLLGTAFSVAAYHHFHKLNRYMLILDAIGLTAFAFIGASRAAQAGLGLVGIMLCAALTAVGGGILSDLLTGRTPTFLYGDFYAVPALLMGILYFLVQKHLTSTVVATLLISICGMRLAALALRWRIWRPHHQPAAHTAVAAGRQMVNT